MALLLRDGCENGMTRLVAHVSTTPLAKLNLNTDKSITQYPAIVATHDQESSPGTGYNGEVPVKEVNDNVKVQKDNE
ncbi:unnamed protein product [Brassica rapa]|uniref:Uncharacterized protein n=2 Tax=Brassica TaxID=3705 RepID=A0A8D9HFE7_BRACM|nr:unnamed protein product [Brassica napus]CAG7897429.1 unnamed protein product [Brassica rapa]